MSYRSLRLSKVRMEGIAINSTEWLPLLQSTVQAKIITPIAWAPILWSLAKSLLNQEQHRLAYECLLAAAVPSAQVRLLNN